MTTKEPADFYKKYLQDKMDRANSVSIDELPPEQQSWLRAT